MTSRDDIPLPAPGHSEAEHIWTDGKAHPTNLIILHPGEAALSSQQVIAALSKHIKGTAQVVAEPKPEDEKTLWDVVLKIPGFEYPVGMWVEPMRPMSDENVKYLGAESIKWSVGLEAILDPERALEEFESLLRLAGRAFPDSPAILDVNKEGWHLREELDETFLPEQEILVEALLWMVHAIGTDDPPKPDSKTWMYTQGLERCGLPELEMIEVPYAQVGAAMGLLNGIAEQLVERGMPAPGQKYEVGPDLHVVFQKLEEVVPFVDEKSLGGMGNEGKNRTDHTGGITSSGRAVVCAAQPQGTYRKLWVWPAEVVQRVAMTGNTVLNRSARAAQRQAQIARATFGDLAGVFALLPSKLRHDNENRQAVFLIKAGLPRTGQDRQKVGEFDDGREYLWFEIKQFKAGRAEALLLNEPHSIEHLRPGDTARIDRGIVSDWQVLTRQGTFGPSNVDGLRQVIEQISGAATR